MLKTSVAVAFGFVLALATVALTTSTQAGADVVLDGWRYTDGNWNYYDPTDKSWYYTNGQNWFTYSDNAWRPYAFDRSFGRKGFVREGYTVPGASAKIVVPRHKVYVVP